MLKNSTFILVVMVPLSKLFIANRGEIASRIIRTAKNLGIKTVAVCNENDQYANYIREVVCVVWCLIFVGR